MRKSVLTTFHWSKEKSIIQNQKFFKHKCWQECRSALFLGTCLSPFFEDLQEIMNRYWSLLSKQVQLNTYFLLIIWIRIIEGFLTFNSYIPNFCLITFLRKVSVHRKIFVTNNNGLDGYIIFHFLGFFFTFWDFMENKNT